VLEYVLKGGATLCFKAVNGGRCLRAEASLQEMDELFGIQLEEGLFDAPALLGLMDGCQRMGALERQASQGRQCGGGNEHEGEDEAIDIPEGHGSHLYRRGPFGKQGN
jgi:hypothetical protein